MTDQPLPDEDVPTTTTGQPVGRSDAAADAARSGADVTPEPVQTDTSGVPEGPADAEADARRSGADPEATT